MAKSFAEAFQLAQAAKAAATIVNSPVLNSASAQMAARPLVSDQALWAQQVAAVKPLASQNCSDLTIGNVTRVSQPLLEAAADKPTSVSGARLITPKPSPARQPKNGRNENLAEYYQRRAQLNAAQSRPAQSSPQYPHLQPLRSAFATKPAVVRDSVTLIVAADAQVVWNGGSAITAALLKNDANLGIRTQISSASTSAREVVLGFDFGTSSAKVVVGDRGLKKAHAVPFRDAVGIDSFLLPARLYEADEVFSLHSGLRHFVDLKLALLADPHDLTLQCRVVAYLALAIQQARAWLFTVHAEDYAKTEIVWTLALGLPAEHAIENSLANVFARIGTAGWSAAGQAIVSLEVCRKALEYAAAAPHGADVEVTVTPEIAAQIYGFVNSSQFDAKSRNLYLIADVGAGTVDTCLFRAIPAKGGAWSFEIYTAAVEPSGVMNLHRHRVGWWQQNLARVGVGKKLWKDLGSTKLGTENQVAIPESYKGYLTGVEVQFSGKAIDPDKDFFRIPLLRQLQSRTLYRAFRDDLLGKQDIANIPFFLCGGGARLEFYRELREAVQSFEGCSWLSTQCQELVMPGELRAEGVVRSDYDRLSVAYGLSMLNLASIATAQQIPKVRQESSAGQWRDHYVDKDQC